MDHLSQLSKLKRLEPLEERQKLEDYKWSPGAGVRTAASRIVEEFWWRFKCDPLNKEQADAALEENFTNKVRQMLHEEKAAAIKRLNKKGQMPTEVDEEGNRWPTKEALISAKPPGFGTVIGWRLLCEHWSTAAFRKVSLTNSKNRLAHGETVFHCSGARSVVSTRQRLKLKTGKDPGITRAWHHTHNLHRGTDQEKICSQRISKRWEDFDDAMTNAHGENWEEEHPELDAQIIYDATGRMPHGRLGIANELFTKTEKSKIKSGRVSVSQPTRSSREDRLERENARLMRENKRLRGIDLVVRSLAEKEGVNYDGIMQSVAPDLATSDSEVGFERGRDASHQHETEKGMGNNTRGSSSREKDREDTDDVDELYDNGYGYGEGGDDGYGYGYGDDHYGNGRGDEDDEDWANF
uniref:Uncharacterized protein n=1 Tax=Avena sativa TaxID=4498 RepID=A0ACD5WNA4_AVESA